MRIVVLGGSASATPELADAILDWPGGVERRPELELVLYARSAERLALVAGESARRLDGAPVSVRTETELGAALEGADVVLDAVRVGGLTARVFDESYPHRHGLPGEETMGPGGFANALRTLPVALGLWAEVTLRAPDALKINLTNPSGIVTAAAERELGVRIFSVCDSPIVFCDKLADRLGLDVDDVRRDYLGMNHLGWWVSPDAESLEAAADLVAGQELAAVRSQGAVGAPYVRYYIHPDRLLAAQQEAGETRAQQLQRLEAELLAGYSSGSSELPRRGAVWYATAVLPLVDAWFNGGSGVMTLGLRNDGRLPGLPDEVVTEGPVRITEPGVVESLPAATLPPLPASLLAQHAAYEALAIRACMPGASRDDRVAALMSNPMVHSYDTAEGLLADIEAGSPA